MSARLNSQMLSDIAAMIEPSFAEGEAWSGTVLQAVTAVQAERDTLRAENERLRAALAKVEDYVRRTPAPSPGFVIDVCMDALSEAQP